MSRARIEKKWGVDAATRRVSRRLRRYWSDYWRTEIGDGVAPVPGRLIPLSKIGRRRRSRKAGAR